jgi:hypothetical protein
MLFPCGRTEGSVRLITVLPRDIEDGVFYRFFDGDGYVG